MADDVSRLPSESVHSPSASAHISHAVIATYAAAAVREVEGVHELAGGHFGPIERRPDPDRPHRGVRVLPGADDAVGLELHVVTEWGASMPEVAARVERQVRAYLASMIDLRVGEVAVVVDDVASPRP